MHNDTWKFSQISWEKKECGTKIIEISTKNIFREMYFMYLIFDLFIRCLFKFPLSKNVFIILDQL